MESQHDQLSYRPIRRISAVPAGQSEIAWLATATGLKRIIFYVMYYIVSSVIAPLLLILGINDVVNIFVITNIGKVRNIIQGA